MMFCPLLFNALQVVGFSGSLVTVTGRLYITNGESPEAESYLPEGVGSGGKIAPELAYSLRKCLKVVHPPPIGAHLFYEGPTFIKTFGDCLGN